ncbi:Citrate synthase 2 [compost metagenome]
MSYQLGKLQGDTTLYDISVRVEQLVTGQKGLKPNVDFYSASVYSMLGIPRDLFTPIFVMSRLSGWTAHIIEQLDDNRIIRPRAEYIGIDGQKYVPLEQR